MENQYSLVITKADYEKLISLISNTNIETAELLEEELSRAFIVADDELPEDVVSMNSKVRFQDLETGNETVVTLVFPHEANIEKNRISILAPIGSALIGLRVGQVIQWPLPNGKEKQVRVLEVLSQHESVSV